VSSRGIDSPRWLGVLFVASAAITSGQQESARVGSEAGFIPRSQPYPQHYLTEPRDYNLKWGKLTGRLRGSAQVEFNDNINLSADGKSDLSFAPMVGFGFLWPLSEKNVLEFDIGIGYRAYLEHPELNSVQISPDSRLTYQIRVLKAQVTIHDQFSIQVDPLSRPELSGSGTVFNYRRFNNDAGVTASWEAIRDVTLVGGYSYVIDRSLNNDFLELDRDDHLAHLGAYRPFGARVTAGLVGGYSITEYVRAVQNDGTSASIGPRLTARLGEFILAEAGAQYTVSEYDQTGTIADRDGFEGFTYFGGLRHRVNSRVSHSLRLSESVGPGYGSNFTDVFALQYGISMKVMAPMTLNGTFVFEDVSSSGDSGEDSQRYLWYLGTALRLSSRWNLGMGYSLGIKDSALPNRDYTQNRVTLELTRHF
jgi:hypothetical protein